MKDFFNGQKFVWSEIKMNKNIIYPLARTSIIKANLASTLGQWWVLIRDIMYYIAFSFMMTIMWGANGSEMDGMDKLVFMTCGMVPFFIFTEVMSAGSSCINKNKTIITKMKFPVVLVPIFEGTSIFLGRILSFIGMLLIVYWFEQFANVEWITFVYYVICTYALAISLNMVMSAFGAISKDFREVVLSILRVLMYFVPIMWPMSAFGTHNVVATVVKLNPMVYVMEGMRTALSTGAGNTLGYTLYFWVIVALLFSIGGYLQYKLRKIYPDVI